MVSAGLLPYAVVDDYKAQIWAKVLPDLTVRSDLAVNQDGEIAWAMRKNSPLLKAKADAFVASHKLGTTFGNILRKRYYTSEKMARRALSVDAQRRYETLASAFRRYGDEFGFEFFLIAAQGYQESELDQNKRSPRGAVGVMQLLPSTAADKSVGVHDIVGSADRNIYAGAKYLRYLIGTYITDEGIDDRNRVLFAFAAYNAGPGNLRKFRAKAAEMGLDANQWFGNVENGAAAIVGRETVQYVSNIYKYYIAYTLAARISADRKAAVERVEAQEK
ncbi:transglycosylase SLT domain-containing protein [Nordella sp. HKS 07]|uniref:transglycosylase SLT domain-containing protein n=1 Tax=Nordella sp. HKS 07 TaxID=2712222 RepID=UPI00352E196B